MDVPGFWVWLSNPTVTRTGSPTTRSTTPSSSRSGSGERSRFSLKVEYHVGRSTTRWFGPEIAGREAAQNFWRGESGSRPKTAFQIASSWPGSKGIAGSSAPGGVSSTGSVTDGAADPKWGLVGGNCSWGCSSLSAPAGPSGACGGAVGRNGAAARGPGWAGSPSGSSRRVLTGPPAGGLNPGRGAGSFFFRAPAGGHRRCREPGPAGGGLSLRLPLQQPVDRRGPCPI